MDYLYADRPAVEQQGQNSGELGRRTSRVFSAHFFGEVQCNQLHLPSVDLTTLGVSAWCRRITINIYSARCDLRHAKLTKLHFSEVASVPVFLDTEFTDLRPSAELISVGAVTDSGEEFYVELTPVPIAKCSPFVQEKILPLLEGGSAVCPRVDFPARLAHWLSQIGQSEILVDSEWDILMLRKTISGQSSKHPGTLILPSHQERLAVNLMILPLLGRSARNAFQVAQLQHHVRDSRLHHALVDAKGIAAGWAAAQTAS